MRKIDAVARSCLHPAAAAAKLCRSPTGDAGAADARRTTQAADALFSKGIYATTTLGLRRLAALGLTLAAGSAQAATIVDNDGSQAGDQGTTFANGNGNADSQVTTLPGVFEVAVTGKEFTGFGPIDIVFSVSAAGDGGAVSTSYRIGENIRNDTGSTITSFVVELGFETGGAFSQSPSGDGLNFSGAASSDAFTTAAVTGDQIVFSGGSVDDGEEFNLAFDVDVPDSLSNNFFTGGINAAAPDFTLRQTPIPSPAAGASGLALLGMTALRRKRRPA